MGDSTGGCAMNWLASLQSRWANASVRERRLLLWAGGFVFCAVVWWIAVSPALRVIQAAPSQHQALDAQLQQMRQLQAKVKALQTQPALTLEETRQALTQSLLPFGATAQVTHLGNLVDRSTVTVKGMRGDALARWLATARQNAHSVPIEAHLKRNSQGTWDGLLIVGGRS